MSKFKVGDRVKISYQGSKFANSYGEIIVVGYDGFYEVKLDFFTKPAWFTRGQLTLDTSAVAQQQQSHTLVPKFKFGDRVLLKNTTQAGIVQVVTYYASRSSFDYGVIFDNDPPGTMVVVSESDLDSAVNSTYSYVTTLPQSTPPGETWTNAGRECTISWTTTECECGKEKHGFASHSSWCAMHEGVE